MAQTSVTGLTAARMLAIEAASVVDGTVVDDNLILTKFDGSLIDAGNVRGPNGIPSPSIELPYAVDLNNYTTQNPHVQSSTIDAQWGTNYPVPLAGLLEVYDNGSDNMVWQRYTPYGEYASIMYIRGKYGAVWSAWSAIPNKAYVDNLNRRERQTRLAQAVLSGGGVRQVIANEVSWSQRFMVMGLGLNSASSSGYFEITMPPNGTAIPIAGGFGSATVANGRVPVPGWHALYYELPLGGGFASDPARFKLMAYPYASGDVPDNWLFIVGQNIDTLTPVFTWGDGRKQDVWRTMTLTNSWVAYGGGYPPPAWRINDDGRIVLRGLMKSGATTLAFSTLPISLMPTFATGASIHLASANGTGAARIDASADGKLSISGYVSPGSNSNVSLDGIAWYPSGS